MAFRLISSILSLSLFCQQAGIAYASGELNLAGYLSSMRNTVVQPDVFQPPRLRYISYDIKSNDFKLLLDKGDPKVSNSPNSSTPKLNPATQELFNYFLIGLALPNDTFWVNLRPDAPENIIDPLLEKTDIGKIFLEADLQLKKDTASLTSPQNPEGKLYWDKLYKKAGELFGSENITIPTITRPWIVPNEVIVRETEDSAYIYKATLKVMLEADYLQNRKTEKPKNPRTEEYGFSDPRLKELNEYSSQIIRETIIPRLTREVNSSKRYAKLRQVYYSLILARWFKQKYSSLGSTRAQEHRSTSLPADNYIGLIDSGNLANLNSREPCDKQAYFQAYQKSFKEGEYNLKETVALPSGQSIRSYISGGVGLSASPLRSGELKIEHNSVTAGLKTGLVPTSQSISSGSPIEMAFWNGETREKGTLTYVRWDELGEDRREKILNNKPFFMEDKTRSNLDVIEAIKGRSGELLSNIRFAFSESGVLEGYIVISKKGNSIAAINAVSGATQWIETALIIAGIRELADISPQVDSILLYNVLRETPYQTIVLRRVVGNKLYNPDVVYQRDFKNLINGYYNYILKEVENEEYNSQTINKSSNSPLVLEENEWKVIIRIQEEVKIFLTENLRQLGYAKRALIEKNLQKEGLKKVAVWIYEYYLEKAERELKGSAVSKDTELKLKQWRENKEDLERILAVDKLKKKIIKAVGKDAGDLGVNSDLILVKTLDELIYFLKKYSAELINKRNKIVADKTKLESEMSGLERRIKNGYELKLEEYKKIPELEKAISSKSYQYIEIRKAERLVKRLIEDISEIRELTGASSSVVMRKKDWETWIGKVRGIINVTDNALSRDFKEEAGSMRSPGDVYGWLKEKNLKLQNKLIEEQKKMSAERHTVYFRANGDSVKYYEERISNVKSIEQQIGEIHAPFTVKTGGPKDDINTGSASPMTWRTLSVPIHGRPYKLHFVSAEDNMDFVLKTLEIPVELYTFDNRKVVMAYISERKSNRIRIALGGGGRVVGALILEKKARIITNVNGKTLDISKALIIAGISELLEVNKDKEPIIINNEYTSLNDDLLNWLNELLAGEKLEKKDRLISVEYSQAEDIVKKWQKKTGVSNVLSSPYLADEPPLLACQKEVIIDALLAYRSSVEFIMFDKLEDIINEKLNNNQKYLNNEAIVELAKSLSSIESRDKKAEFLTSIIKGIKSKEALKDAQMKERSEFLLKVMKAYFFVMAIKTEIGLNEKKDGLGRFFEEIEKGAYFRPEEEIWLNEYIFKEGLNFKEHFLRDAIKNIVVTLGRDTGYELPEEKYKIISLSVGLVNIAANVFVGSSSSLSADARTSFREREANRGGIDFTDRAMRLNIERVGSFAYLKLVLPRVQNVQGLDLDKEFRQIEAIASSGIVPNSRRILELFSACYSRGEFGQRLPQVISALKSSSAIQESLAIDSDDDFRLCLLLPEIFYDGN